jgi:hypothetical protein
LAFAISQIEAVDFDGYQEIVMNTSATDLHKLPLVVPWLRCLSYGVSVITIIGFAAGAISAESSKSTLSIPQDQQGVNTSSARKDNLSLTATSEHRATGRVAATPALPMASKHGVNNTSAREAECIHKGHQRLHPNADDGANYLATF